MDKALHLKTIATQFMTIIQKLKDDAEDAADTAIGVLKRLDHTLGTDPPTDLEAISAARDSADPNTISDVVIKLTNAATDAGSDKLASARAALIEVLSAPIERPEPAAAAPAAFAGANLTEGDHGDDVDEDDDDDHLDNDEDGNPIVTGDAATGSGASADATGQSTGDGAGTVPEANAAGESSDPAVTAGDGGSVDGAKANAKHGGGSHKTPPKKK